jgi:glycosyltransferase involved in cell wall biosynthesis
LTSPEVSVVVTSYQQSPYLRECLESVRAQTFTDWHLVVVDDASEDGSPDLIRDWVAETGVDAEVLVNEANVGVCESLNRALPRCRGRYLAYLGGDDSWAPTKLEHQVERIDGDGDAAVVYTDARVVDAEGDLLHESFMTMHELLPPAEGDVFQRLIRQNFMVASGVMYRTDAVREAGGWDPALSFEDWDLQLRIARRHPFLFDGGTHATYRIHDASMTRSRFSHMLLGRMGTLEKWIGADPESDEFVDAYLREQSWRVFKVHPDRAREHVLIAYRRPRDLQGWLRRLVARRRWAESAFEGLRRVRRVVRR